MQERQISFLGQEDPLEEEMATHSSILAWEIPRTEEAGGLQSMGPQRVRISWATEQHTLVTGFRRVLEPPQVWGSYRHRLWSVSSWATLQDPLSPLLTPATTEMTKFRFYQPHWLHLKSSSPRCTACSCFLPVSFLVCSTEHPEAPWTHTRQDGGVNSRRTALVQHTGVYADASCLPAILPRGECSDTSHDAPQEVAPKWVQVAATSTTLPSAGSPLSPFSALGHILKLTTRTQASVSGSAFRGMRADMTYSQGYPE